MVYKQRALGSHRIITDSRHLVNNAGHGTGQGKSFEDLTTEEVHKAFALNTFSTFYATQAAAKYIRHGGRIVNIGSIVSRMPNLPGVSLYGASKAGQEYLTGAIATEVITISFIPNSYSIVRISKLGGLTNHLHSSGRTRVSR